MPKDMSLLKFDVLSSFARLPDIAFHEVDEEGGYSFDEAKTVIKNRLKMEYDHWDKLSFEEWFLTYKEKDS